MSIKSLFSKSKPYLLLALINVVFFLIPLACNFYVDDVKIEDASQKIANVASSSGGEQNTVAVTLKSSNEGKTDSGSNVFGVDVAQYNGLFANCLQLTDGLLAYDLDFSYNGVSLNEVNYVLTSGSFSNHQGKRGTLFDKYQVYLYSTKANTNYDGANNFCYITERTAQKIMAADPEIADYDGVINKTLTVGYGDIVHTWKIGNIIMDKEEFYSQMSFIYGDFILAYIHLPGGLGKKVSLSAYFGSNTYLNMDKVSSLFSLDNPTYEIYRGNLGDCETKTLDEIDSFLNNFSYNKALTIVYYIEIGAVVLLNAFLSWLYFKKKTDLKLAPSLISGIGSLIVVYVPFWIAYKASRNIYCLSHMGVLGLMIVFACAEAFILLFNLYSRREEKQ